MLTKGTKARSKEAKVRAKMAIPLALVSALVAGLVGMGAASGQTALHLVLRADTQRVREIDLNRPGLRLGDRVAARGTLTDAEGATLGTSHADCVVQVRIAGPETGLWNCTYVLDLADGDLVLRGLDPRGPGAYEMAVLGGTGAYEDASGDATFTDTFDEIQGFDKTDMMITLSK